MRMAITGCSSLRAKGLVDTEGDVPGRSIYFGRVDAPLPEIADPEFNFRTCRLLAGATERLAPCLDGFLSRYAKDRVAVVLGTSNTGIDEAQRYVDGALDSEGASRFGNLRFSMIELGTPARYLARTLGVTGPAYAISTACSSSSKVFPAARRLIETGVCDAAVVGGADGRCRFAMNGFYALGALAQERCRPLADDRDGICLGEGVALFLMEREQDAAASDGRSVFFLGAGESSDAYHATAPDPEGCGAEAAMRAALDDAGCRPGDIDYVNLHGTGTQANDAMEMKAVRRVFGDALQTRDGHPISIESTKSRTGHCLGAAGAVEAAICWRRLRNGEISRALSNSFAFGGSNASIVLG